jgi:hypothetical protein
LPRRGPIAEIQRFDDEALDLAAVPLRVYTQVWALLQVAAFFAFIQVFFFG